jgi:hypothetical protein
MFVYLLFPSTLADAAAVATMAKKSEREREREREKGCVWFEGKLIGREEGVVRRCL